MNIAPMTMKIAPRKCLFTNFSFFQPQSMRNAKRISDCIIILALPAEVFA